MSKPTHPDSDKTLLREIILVLIIKLILLFAIWHLFFHNDRPDITTDDIHRIMLSEPQGESL